MKEHARRTNKVGAGGPLTVIGVVALLALVPTVGAAQPGPAGRYLERRHGEINRILDRSSRNEERARNDVTEILRELLDLDTMGRVALGDHWDEHPDDERSRFQSMLRQLVERSYRRNLENTSDFDVSYGEEEPHGDRILVHTVARNQSNRRAPEITIDYLLRREGEAFVVEDITTDGVSMVRNYRSQFGRIIRRDGWEALLDRMEARLDSEEEV